MLEAGEEPDDRPYHQALEVLMGSAGADPEETSAPCTACCTWYSGSFEALPDY